jgi:tetratricopeptide (TPR) repeat protein
VTAYSNLAWARWKVGDREGSLKASREAKDICKELIKIDPNNTEWTNARMAQLNILAHNFKVLGRKEEAAEIIRERTSLLKQWIAVLRNKVKGAPESAEGLENLTRERNQLISNLLEIEENDEVLSVLQEAIDEGRQHIANNPASIAWHKYLTVALRDLGGHLNKMERDNEADNVYKESAATCWRLVALTRELMNQNPKSEKLLKQLTEAQFLLLGILKETGEEDKLQELVTEVIDDARKCLAEEPDDHKWLITRSKWLQWFSRQVMGIRLRDATESVKMSMLLADSAVAQMPEDIEYLKTLEGTQYDLVRWQSRLGRHEESLKVSRSWAPTLARIADLDPGDCEEIGGMCLRLLQVGRNWERLGHKDAAREIWEQAVLIIEPVTSGPDRSSVVSEHLDTHAQVLLHLNRVDEARPLVDELLKRKWVNEAFLMSCFEHGLLPWQNDPDAYREQVLGRDGSSSNAPKVDLPPLISLADVLEEHWNRMEAETSEPPPRVRVRGVVTAAHLRLFYRGHFFIQDKNVGLLIEDPTLRGKINQTLEVGMHVELVGRIIDYRGSHELKPDLPIRVLGREEVPEAIRVNASGFSPDRVNTVVDLGRVDILEPENIVVGRAFDYRALDEEGTELTFRVEPGALIHERFWGPDNSCHVRGVLTRFDMQYFVLVRSIEDLR